MTGFRFLDRQRDLLPNGYELRKSETCLQISWCHFVSFVLMMRFWLNWRSLFQQFVYQSLQLRDFMNTDWTRNSQ